MIILRSAARALDRTPRFKSVRLPNHYTSHWIDLRYGRTRYVLTGAPDSKFTVVLAPDPPNTIEQMSPLIELLAQRYQVLVFDMLGFGYSSFNADYDFSINRHGATTVELLQQLNIDNAILAQTCAAALPGLKAAREHPELIKGVVIGQTADLPQAKSWAKRVDFNGMMGRPILGQLFLRAIRNKVSQLWYKNAFPKGYTHHPFAQETLRSFKQGARFSLASAFQSLLSQELPANEFTIQQPAVLVWGEKDRSHMKTNPDKTMELLPNGELVRLKDCGHFPDIEMPEEFAKAVHSVAVRVGENP